MEEFDREMKKMKVDFYAGSVCCSHPVTENKEIRKLNGDALRLVPAGNAKRLPGMK